jgi:calcineurin-like phosphoesterase family protein
MNWFTSDHHFGHSNVIKYCDRPFLSVERMDEKLVELWNSVVREADNVYNLGDLSMGSPAVEKYSSRLNGHKFLVPGNHDSCHPHHKKANTEQKRKEQNIFYQKKGWEVLPLSQEFTLGNLKVVATHLPYKGIEDAHEHDKYDKYKLEDNGLWLLHGHVHQHWKIKGNMLNVGVDVWDFKPVSEKEIIWTIEKTMSERSKI